MTKQVRSYDLDALARILPSKAGFGDCLIACLGDAAGCHETVTFDVDAARFAGM